MKVLQINSVCKSGSTGRIVADLYEALHKKEQDCLIAYGRGNAPDGMNTYRIGSDFDVKLHALYTRLTDKTGFASKQATKKFLKQIAEYNPDIIHLHNLHGYYLNVEVLFHYLAACGKPIVWTLHDCWAFTGHCPHFTVAQCDLWRIGCDHCPQRIHYPASLLLDHSKWNYEKKKQLFTLVKVENMKIIAVSNWLKKIVAKSFLGKYPIKTIYNGIDLNIFQPVETAIRSTYKIDNKFMVLGVSDGWNERKGLLHFIQLAKIAPEDMIFVLVGLTSKQIKKLPQNIIGLTRTSNVHELVELYSAADVFLNPSREETFGIVTVEAMACGTPAIVFNTTACPELVDKTCGIVVENMSTNALLAAIDTLRTSQLVTLESCRNHARLFNEAVQIENVISLYHSLMNNRSEG